MKRAHKKILGSIGLGVVVATTAVAATIPSPMAAAVTAGSVTDTIKVTVLSPNPDLIPSTDKGDIITTPDYDFSVYYSSLLHIKATLVNYDADGNIKYSEVLWDEDLDGSAGSKDFDLNLDDYGGYGNFAITFTGTGGEGVEVEQILSVAYVIDVRDIETNPDTGEADTEVSVPSSDVSSIETYVYDSDGALVRILKADPETGVLNVYDASGNLLFTINDGYEYGVLVIAMTGLSAGDYSGKIVFRDASGDLVSGMILLNIKHQTSEIIVPDTGNFFQGLNISREDYLITGLIAFMVIGVVAFGIVKRNHSDATHVKSGRINGKNRR